MPVDAEATPDPRLEICHEMLLRLAGKAPDDLVTSCRYWLADGEVEKLVRAISYFVTTSNTAVPSSDAAALAELLEEYGADAAALADIEIDESEPIPPYEFAAELPAELATARSTAVTGTGADKAEQELIETLAAEPGAIGGWRAWRFPADRSPWPPARRVFVIETSPSTNKVALTERLQQKLRRAGESTPQVEVYGTGQDVPIYQLLARGCGDLVWAKTQDPGIQIATVFDSVDPEAGPAFNSDHPKLDEEEAAKVAAYLYGGEQLLITTALMDDVADTTRQNCVPMSFRTDGRWIWTEAAAYYVTEHHLAPDAALLAHIRETGHTSPAVDGVGVFRALQVLQAPADEEPV